MRKICNMMAVLALFVAASCAPEYEQEYTSLRMDYTEMELSDEEGKALLMIYYSGGWTAAVTEGNEWASLERSSGSGISENRVFVEANTGHARSAVITVTAADGEVWTLTLTQKATTVVTPRERTVNDILEHFEQEKVYATDDALYADYVTLYVVGGAGNPNMDHNSNIGPNTINTSENDRTVYMQDKASGATQGFRVKFDTAESNTLAHGDCVKLSLDGLTLLKEDAPQRYTIAGVGASSVEVVSSGNEMVPNECTIAELAPADVYTYCRLTGVEFQVKQGAYTNVREYAAIRNPLTSSSLTENYLDTERSNGGLVTASQFAMDGAANLLYDASGDVIYALFNMGCGWRRNPVPDGSGSISGVVVHQDMPRWGGNVGTYSIRPLTEDDVTMGTSSDWKTVAEWVLVEDADHNSYSWKGGYSGAKAATLHQNKMIATGGEDTEAVIYSENLNGLTTGTNKHAKGATPVTVEYGYRGLDMTSPDVAEKYGMSGYSAITFWGNACGWYNWNENAEVYGYNGIVMEFSSKTVSGSQMSVGFSIAAGYPNVSKPLLNIALQSSTSFPVYWTVEYAVGDNGPWTEVRNEATDVNGFEMRSIPWTLDGTVKYVPHYGTKTSIVVETQSDTGFGLVPYRFNLPASALGQDKVKVRIRPTSDIVMTLNARWDAGIASEQLHAVAQSAQKTNVNHGVILEDVVIQYR